MALTKQNWKDILDKIYNNGLSYKTYSGDNLNGIKLYVNYNNKFVTRVDEDTTYIVAIIPEEPWTYVVDGETKSYVCNTLNDDEISGSVSNIYARGASGWLNIKTYIRNICSALGVKMSKDFDEVNPVFYQDFVNICHKWFNTNKAIYYFGRYDNNGTPTYQTYVQGDVMADIAKYLVSLGIFSTQQSTFSLSQPLYIDVNSNTIPNLPSFSDLYTFKSKDKVISQLKTKFVSVQDSETIIDLFLNQYPECDFDNNYLDFIIFDQTQNRVQLDCIELPRSCIAFNNTGSGVYTYSGSRYIYNSKENFNKVSYTITYNRDTQEVTHNKSVNAYNKSTTSYSTTGISSTEAYSNIENDYYFKPYGQAFIYNSSYYFRLVDHYDTLNSGAHSNIKLLSFNEFLKSGMYSHYILKVNKDLDVTFSSNDLVIDYTLSNWDGRRITIVRNVNGKFSTDNLIFSTYGNFLGFINGRGTSQSSYTDIPNSISLQKYGYNQSMGGIITFTFDSSLDYETYEITSDSQPATLIGSGSTQSITINPSNAYFGIQSINIGELVDNRESLSFDGLEVISGATYPSSVVDKASFMAWFNSLNKGHVRYINNPYIIDEELQSNLVLEDWISCTTYKNPPVSQDEALDNDIDDMPDDEVDELEKTIDPDVDPNEEDDEDSDKDNGDEESNDDGYDVADLPNACGLLKYYVLTWNQLNQLYTELKDKWNSPSQLLNNPLEAIVSLQSGFYFPMEGATTETLNINGVDYDNPNIEVSKLAVSTTQPILLGSELVRAYEVAEDYRDLENVYLQVYLPFIGVVDVDFKVFYNKYLAIECMIDVSCGSINYRIVQQEEQGATTSKGHYSGHIIATYNGICQQQFPLKQDAFMNFINSLNPLK